MSKAPVNLAWVEERRDHLLRRLLVWSNDVEPNGFAIGKTFARIKLRMNGKSSIRNIRRRAEDLKVHLGLDRLPIITAQPGFISIDLELPFRTFLALSDIPMASEPASSSPIFPAGEDINGNVHFVNLSEPTTCHFLIAGMSGSGKSELLRAIIAWLARCLGPKKLQFILVDPKQVTFNLGGRSSPFLRYPVVHKADEAVPLIQDCVREMERRFKLFNEQGIGNISELNEANALPRIIVAIDELADVMIDRAAKTALEIPLRRLGGMARAAGIHLLLATQRPDSRVVTPQLRANLPGRICLQVASEAESNLIMDFPDAANLLGKGDLLLKVSGKIVRLQSPFAMQLEFETALRTTGANHIVGRELTEETFQGESI